MTELTRAEESRAISQTRKPGLLRFFLFLLIGCLSLCGLLYFVNSSKKAPVEAKKDRAVPVTVAVAVAAELPVEIRSIGNVTPFSTVNVVPQVSGQLRKVFFKQGDHVKKGELLFQIDPSPYEAALAQAEGNAAKDEALVRQAEATKARDEAVIGQFQANYEKDRATAFMAGKQKSRYESLASDGAVSREQSDQMNTNLDVAEAALQSDLKQIENAKNIVEADKAAIQTAKAQVQADLAQVRSAKIQLGWTTIRSPINGKTGSLNVYEGNVVTAQSNQPLVSIMQLQPIFVTFTVPELNLDQVRRALKAKTLTIQADIEGAKTNAVTGAVSFLENTVNTSTGTVMMRASFANDDLRLFPGQFVDVTVSIPAPGKSVVVPTTALQTTQQGSAVYVVNSDKSVSLCPVELLRTTADNAAIGKGIKAGDLVVTDGQLQLGPDSRVKVLRSNGRE